jgi:hypothetical protein
VPQGIDGVKTSGSAGGKYSGQQRSDKNYSEGNHIDYGIARVDSNDGTAK